MNALEEIKFRSASCARKANIRPAEDRPPPKKALGYRICSGYCYGAFIYNTSMNLDDIARTNLTNMLELGLLAEKADQRDKLLSLESIYVAKSHLSEDLTGLSRSIADEASTTKNELANPLYAVLSCLRLGLEYQPYMTSLKKWEIKKYTSILPGTTNAICHIFNKDEDSLVATIDTMLLAHHKEANNRHSNIYNSHAAFLSLAPYLIIELAKSLDMNIRSRISKNKQTLKLGLSSPADFPEIPKNHKMLIEVDYLTGKTNIVV